MSSFVRPLLAAAVLAMLLVLQPLDTPATEAAGPGTWSPAASMPGPRESHSLTLLRSGNVLMAGGSGGPGSFVYSPAANAWTATGNVIPDVHISPETVLLRDGRVLVAGGSGAINESANLYDPGTNLWAPAADMSVARSAMTATLLLDGRVLVVGGQSAAAQVSAELYDPAVDSWTPAAPTLAPRVEHSARLLDDGRVLVAGGYGEPNPVATEIYDPATDAWSPAGDLTTGRASAAIAGLPGGRVVIVGGFDGLSSVTATAEVFDPVTETWSPAGSMSEPRVHHTAALLGNGKVLVAFGDDNTATGYFASADLYDPDTNTWSPTGVGSVGRNVHAMTLLSDGRALVSGGYTTPGGPTSLAELYDATSWRTVAPMSTGRGYPGLSILHDGRLLAAGSGSAEVYDPVTDAWTPTGPMSATRRAIEPVLLQNGKVFVAGGLGGSGSPYLPTLDSTETYDPVTNDWTPGAVRPSPGAGATLRLNGAQVFSHASQFYFDSSDSAVYNPSTNTWSAHVPVPYPPQIDGVASLLRDGRVLLTGGWYYSGPGPATAPQNHARIFSPMTGMWSSGSPMAGMRGGGHTSTLLDSALVLVAGKSTAGSSEIYDPVTDAWTPTGEMLVPRSEHSATLLENGRVLTAGGSGIALEATAEIFVPNAESWSSAGSMNQARSNHGATRLTNGNVLVAGGFSGGTELASAEIYDIGTNFDTDGDGYNDGLELALGQHPWSSCATMRADVNQDGVVNSIDLGKMSAKFGVRPPPSRLDQNADTVINSIDQGKMASKFNQSVLMCP